MDNKLKWQEILDRCEHGKGWYGLVIEVMNKIELIYQENNISMSEFHILQIKQKFGELIIYYSKSPLKDQIDTVIKAARIKSTQTCESCGKKGRIYGDWRISSLCEKCAKSEGYDPSIE